MWQLMVPNYGTIRAAGAIPGEAIGSDWKLRPESELSADHAAEQHPSSVGQGGPQ